jgi:ABC-type multidrug transport system permease subunit
MAELDSSVLMHRCGMVSVLMILSSITFSVRMNNLFFASLSLYGYNFEMSRDNHLVNKICSMFLFYLPGVSACSLAPKTVHSLATHWNRPDDNCDKN